MWWRYNPDPIDYYRQMYSPSAQVGDARIKNYIRSYQRRDRITYIIRLDRVAVLAEMLEDLSKRHQEVASPGTMPWHAKPGDTPESLKAEFAVVSKRFFRALRRSRTGLEKLASLDIRNPKKYILVDGLGAAYSLQNLSKYIVDTINKFHHYIRNATINNYETVLDIHFGDQSPEELLEALDVAEEIDEEEADEKLIAQERGEVVISFSDGYYWTLLTDGDAMELEGQAMRHCGTPAEGNYLLSLRSPTETGVKAHVTFEWSPQIADDPTFDGDNWGYVGEMKGRANTKPKPKYHPYIVELLRHPAIRVVVGGGYDPKNNFSLDDLDEEVRKKLLSEKPGLRGFDKLRLPPRALLQYLHNKFPHLNEVTIDAANNKFILGEYDYDAMQDLLSRIHGGMQHNSWRVVEEARGGVELLKKILAGNFWPDYPSEHVPYSELIAALEEPLQGALRREINHYGEMPDYVVGAGQAAMEAGVEAGLHNCFIEALKDTRWECGSRVYEDRTEKGVVYRILADPGKLIQYLSLNSEEDPTIEVTSDSTAEWTNCGGNYADPMDEEVTREVFQERILDDASPRLRRYLKQAKEGRQGRRF